jgi:hypothetical protein
LNSLNPGKPALQQCDECASGLATSLDGPLGTEANVRLLRVLVSEGRFLTPAELALRTGLTRAAVYRALARLHRSGVAELGTVGGKRYRFAASHPLAAGLEPLFRVERERCSTVVRALRSAVEALQPAPISAWIERPPAGPRRDQGEPVVVGILDTPAHIDRHVEELQETTVPLQRSQDVTIEVRGWTRADLRAATVPEQERVSRSTPLYGPAAETFAQSPDDVGNEAPAHHGDLESRSLALATEIARRVEADPALIERAREWLGARLAQASASEATELREWDRILRSTTPARLGRLLTAESERAIRLRQSNPFVGVLKPAERTAILRRRVDDEG